MFHNLSGDVLVADDALGGVLWRSAGDGGEIDSSDITIIVK